MRWFAILAALALIASPALGKRCDLDGAETDTCIGSWGGGKGQFELQTLGGGATAVALEYSIGGSFRAVDVDTSRGGEASCSLTVAAQFCSFVAPAASTLRVVVTAGTGSNVVRVWISGPDEASAGGGGVSDAITSGSSSLTISATDLQLDLGGTVGHVFSLDAFNFGTAAMTTTVGIGWFRSGAQLHGTANGTTNWAFRFSFTRLEANTSFGGGIFMGAALDGTPTFNFRADDDTGFSRDATTGGPNIVDEGVEIAVFSSGGVNVTVGALALFCQTSPPAGGAVGDMYCDSDLNLPCFHNGTDWLQMDDFSTVCS